MWLLLNPRVWIALAIAVFFTFTHFTAYRKGKAVVTAEWNAEKAQQAILKVEATNEARKLERARQSNVDGAQRLAAAREVGLRADAALARDAVGRLRESIAARTAASESAAAANQRADTLGKLLLESADAYRELAEAADRHVNDVRLLLDAWPK